MKLYVFLLFLITCFHDVYSFVQPGKPIMVVNGRGRGCRGTLLRINEDKYNAVIRIEEGPLSGREIERVEYEDISKIPE